MKINEIISEQQINEFGFKDLTKGWKQGTLGKSIGQGINTAGKNLGKSITQGNIADKAISAGSKVAGGINKATDAAVRGVKGAPGVAKAFGQSVKDTGQMAQDILPGTSSYVKSFGTAGNRLAKQFVGKDPNATWLSGKEAPAGAPSYASYSDDYKPSHNGEVFVVKARGQEYFKSYKDRWYQKTSMNPNDFSITHPLDDYKDYAVLDKLLQQGNYDIVSVKRDPISANSFVATGRKPAGDDDTGQSSIVNPATGKPF